VDIDFPAVFRAMSGLDSLAQAAGRCNREGDLPGKGRFVVFRPELPPPLKHVRQAIEAAEAALRRHADAPFSPAAFEVYFRALYWAKGDEALDAFDVIKLLRMPARDRHEGDPLDLRFRTAAERFRMIEDGQEAVVVPYDETAKKHIQALRQDGASRGLLRGLQPYTVPVTRRDMARLRAAAAVEDLDGVSVLVRPALYRDDIGLDWDALPAVDDFIK